MPGLKLLTKLDPKICLKIAWRTAQDLSYAVTPIDDSSTRFSATKGHVLLSILTGPLAPHCQFEISVAVYSDANEVVLEKNVPWLTSGKIGVNKVNRQAEALFEAILNAIEKEGGTVMEHKKF